MCGGPLCTRLSARNVLGEKKNMASGRVKSRRCWNSLQQFFFFSFCTMQRCNILHDSAFPKAPVCACGRGGRTNIQHQTASFPTWERFRRNRRASAGTPKRRPPLSILNTTNKNAASKRPRRRHHRFQQGTLPSTHTPINKKEKKNHDTRFSQCGRDKCNVYKHSQCNLCLEKHLFWWQQRQTRSSMSKVNNNNQQITAIKRVITARDNGDKKKKKKTLLSHQLAREGGWGEGGVL